MKTKTLAISEPVTVDEAERQCYLIEPDQQTKDHLKFLIKVARVSAENYTWSDFRAKEVEGTIQSPAETIEIPDLREVVSISFNGQDFENYEVLGNEVTGDWPEGEMKIIFKTEPEEPVKMAILYLVKQFFDNRDTVDVSHGSVSVNEIPMTAKYLLGPYSQRRFV